MFVCLPGPQIVADVEIDNENKVRQNELLRW